MLEFQLLILFRIRSILTDWTESVLTYLCMSFVGGLVNFLLVDIEMWFLHDTYWSMKMKMISQRESIFPVFLLIKDATFKEIKNYFQKF